jgi:hypothetical protein
VSVDSTINKFIRWFLKMVDLCYTHLRLRHFVGDILSLRHIVSATFCHAAFCHGTDSIYVKHIRMNENTTAVFTFSKPVVIYIEQLQLHSVSVF